MDYKTAGVDVQAGRAFVDRIRSSVQKTARPEVIGGIGGFGGLMRLPQGLSKPVLVAGADGVGTKLELAQDHHSHKGVGIDAVAMCVNDVITSGAEPLFFLDYIATGKLAPQALSEVIEGIAEGCVFSKCVLLGGETAEMPGFYSNERYDIAGFCLAVVEEEKIINGSEIKSGDQIIGVQSSGVHSNGFSLVRKVLSKVNADQKTVFGSNRLPLIETLLKPTVLYVELVQQLLLESIPLKGMAHITGGGLPENLPRCLPNGLVARIDKNSWDVPEIFQWLKKEGQIPEADLWNTFNMGIGFCLVVPIEKVQAVIEISIGNGYQAWPIGEVQKSELSDKPKLLGL
ncbi:MULTISPECIES: phosphoribosylformylglycinamidine cyclo-ligase [Prochlorococcus]|uniref:phosphoribosylformylglycinamidine cyclo-ligase n=1 Tax=Prochlorococcus TaxID=1218 RepID=UPI000533A669|nr:MULTISPECIES: phosphoribosylformylglycinamidine cyclo-ligase [Prochlorococcus]KGG13614.1 Phosphoribosylformylglycinamidine cyclo-ligase [Prochlorococcus sp. MIT 0601]